MKQHLSPEDWGLFERENPKQAKRLREYYSNWQEKYLQENYPNQFVTMDWWPIFIFLNIGQMIEYLTEHSPINWDIRIHKPYFDVNYPESTTPDYEDYEQLCDALWEAVKDILEKEDK